VVAFAQEASLKVSPEDSPPPTPPITDCATDFRERGRPTERPGDPAEVADLSTALELDLRASASGFDLKQALEPLCFYVVPEYRIMLRDGSGIEYYFHKVPKWDIESVAIMKPPN